MATITPTGGALSPNYLESVVKHLIEFRNSVVGCGDSRATTILSTLDALIDELYSNAAKTPTTSTYSYTALAAQKYDLSKWAVGRP